MVQSSIFWFTGVHFCEHKLVWNVSAENDAIIRENASNTEWWAHVVE